MIHVLTLVLMAAQPASAGQIGVAAVAPQTMKGNPATFDLAGFRLGMTEADVERNLKERGLTVRRRTRVDTFEDRVRKLVNLRGGRLPLKGGSVLDNADLDDGKGGKVMIRMLGWPDGARIRSVTYLPPVGTNPAAWRSLLVGKYGRRRGTATASIAKACMRGGAVRRRALAKAASSASARTSARVEVRSPCRSPKGRRRRSRRSSSRRHRGVGHMTDRPCRAECRHSPLNPAE